MFPKLWKALFLAPLAVTLITGCGNDRKHSDSNTSRYSGFWLERKADRDFEISKKGRNAGEAYAILCRRALSNRGVHGLPTGDTWNGAVGIKAYHVTTAGEVFRWGANLDLNNPEVRATQFIGHVNEAGYLPHDNSLASAGQTRPWSPNQVGNASILDLALDGQSLALKDANGGYKATYVRVSQADMNTYSSYIDQCAQDNLQLVQQSGAYDQQGPVEYQQGPAGPDSNYVDQGDGSDEGDPAVVPVDPNAPANPVRRQRVQK